MATVCPRSGVTPLPRLTLAAALATPQKRRSAAKMRLGRDSVLGAGEHMTALLRVRDLVVDFNTEQGLVCVVNGASYRSIVFGAAHEGLDEVGVDQAHGPAGGLEKAAPMMSAAAGFHRDDLRVELCSRS